jgi:hypothetical protein
VGRGAESMRPMTAIFRLSLDYKISAAVAASSRITNRKLIVTTYMDRVLVR